MKILLKTITIGLLAFTCYGAQATLQQIDTDELGSYTVVKDTASGNEWLRSSYSRRMSVNEALSLYAADGWIVADYEEVKTFFNSAKVYGEKFQTMYGTNTGDYGFGLYNSYTSDDYMVGYWRPQTNNFNVDYNENITVSGDEKIPSSAYSVFLYRNEETIRNAANYIEDVPSPLFASILLPAAFLFRRRKA